MIVKVQEGKGAEFERLVADITAKVRANEPENLLYQLTELALENWTER